MLAVVLWAFTRLQIGVSRAGALQSGMAAIPVFLLWAHASWLVILLGAQIAIAHELDGILIHGASALSLDPYGEQVAGLQIMVETTRRALSSPDDALSTRTRRNGDGQRAGARAALASGQRPRGRGAAASGGLASPGRIRRVSPGVRSRRDGLA